MANTTEFVKFMAVTGPLLSDRRPLYVARDDIRGIIEQPPEGTIGIINSALFVRGFASPLVVSGGADMNFGRALGPAEEVDHAQ